MSYSSVQSNQSCRLHQIVLVLDTLLQCHKNIGVKTICCAKDGMMYLTKLANIHDILLQCQTQCLLRCCKNYAWCRGKRYLAEVANIHKARVQGERVCHVHEYNYYLQNQIC